MAHGVTAYKAWLQDQEAATGPRKIQFVELTFTAANTDTDWDFGDTNGTFWAAADGTTAGAAAEAIFDQLVAKVSDFLGLRGTALIGYFSAAAASGNAVIYTAGTNFTDCPNLTFASGSAPTAGTLIFSWLLKQDEVGIETSGSD